MAIYQLNDDRMLCWDDFFIDRQENTEIRQHKPVKRERVFTADQAWEGNVCGYGSLLKVGDKYRLYYRANNYVFLPDGTAKGNKSCFCVAESSDLKAFRRMPINRCTYEGVLHNNIYFDQSRDNFAIIYDENPACPENERFKALSMGGGAHYSQDGGPHGLYLFVSADGLEFTLKGRLPLPGTFDSYNIMFWDHETKQYYFFYRGEHRTDGAEIEFDVVKKERTIFREIRMSTSPDLVTFEHHGPLDFGKGHIPMQLYTNQVMKYYRARDMFIGFPMRYCDRWEDPESFKQMPLAERHAYMTEHWGREGTAITDCSLITSRDGYHFHKWDEAYLTPGVEERNNWWYGNCCMVYGMEETPSDTEGAPNEISMLMPDNYRIKALEYYRYTTRLDGFVSWYAKLSGGRILTKPFTFTGNELELNFASSAFGDVVVTICDAAGNPLEGYRSNRIFGDSVARKVSFQKELSALKDVPVRLEFCLRDADLYSFKFNL